MPSRSKPSRYGAPPSVIMRTMPAVHTCAGRPLSARELQLASDVELARGNHLRGEMLAWRAHEARTGIPA